MSNIYRWRFPLSLHCKPPSAPVAFEDQGNRRDAEHPAAANGRDGEDWQPPLLHASPLRADSLWKWISISIDQDAKCYNLFLPKQRHICAAHTSHCTFDVRFPPLEHWDKASWRISKSSLFSRIFVPCTSRKHFRSYCDQICPKERELSRISWCNTGWSHEIETNQGVVGSCCGSGSVPAHCETRRMQRRGSSHMLLQLDLSRHR